VLHDPRRPPALHCVVAGQDRQGSALYSIYGPRRSLLFLPPCRRLQAPNPRLLLAAVYPPGRQTSAPIINGDDIDLKSQKIDYGAPQGSPPLSSRLDCSNLLSIFLIPLKLCDGNGLADFLTRHGNKHYALPLAPDPAKRANATIYGIPPHPSERFWSFRTTTAITRRSIRNCRHIPAPEVVIELQTWCIQCTLQRPDQLRTSSIDLDSTAPAHSVTYELLEHRGTRQNRRTTI